MGSQSSRRFRLGLGTVFHEGVVSLGVYRGLRLVVGCGSTATRRFPRQDVFNSRHCLPSSIHGVGDLVSVPTTR